MCRSGLWAIGLDQQELAEAMGVSRSTVTNAERGNHGVRKIVLNAWSMATGVSAHWLQTGEAPASDDSPDGGDGVRHQGLEPRTRWLGVGVTEVPRWVIVDHSDEWTVIDRPAPPRAA